MIRAAFGVRAMPNARAILTFGPRFIGRSPVVVTSVRGMRLAGRAPDWKPGLARAGRTPHNGTMSDPRLRNVVEEMRAQLASAEGLPAGTRGSLEELVRDLETLAGPAGADAEFSASLRERATDALRRLEASHPVLSSTLGNVVDTLAFFGL